MTLDSKQAHVLAARSKSRRRVITLEDATELLGALETPRDAQRWLRQIVLWGTSGMIPGSMAQAAASCVREWLKAHAEQVDAEQIKHLMARIRELEDELKSGRQA
jgi:hypothetical protein